MQLIVHGDDKVDVRLGFHHANESGFCNGAFEVSSEHLPLLAVRCAQL